MPHTVGPYVMPRTAALKRASLLFDGRFEIFGALLDYTSTMRPSRRGNQMPSWAYPHQSTRTQSSTKNDSGGCET